MRRFVFFLFNAIKWRNGLGTHGGNISAAQHGRKCTPNYLQIHFPLRGLKHCTLSVRKWHHRDIPGTPAPSLKLELQQVSKQPRSVSRVSVPHAASSPSGNGLLPSSWYGNHFPFNLPLFISFGAAALRKEAGWETGFIDCAAEPQTSTQAPGSHAEALSLPVRWAGHFHCSAETQAPRFPSPSSAPCTEEDGWCCVCVCVCVSVCVCVCVQLLDRALTLLLMLMW